MSVEGEEEHLLGRRIRSAGVYIEKQILQFHEMADDLAEIQISWANTSRQANMADLVKIAHFAYFTHI